MADKEDDDRIVQIEEIVKAEAEKEDGIKPGMQIDYPTFLRLYSEYGRKNGVSELEFAVKWLEIGTTPTYFLCFFKPGAKQARILKDYAKRKVNKKEKKLENSVKIAQRLYPKEERERLKETVSEMSDYEVFVEIGKMRKVHISLKEIEEIFGHRARIYTSKSKLIDDINEIIEDGEIANTRKIIRGKSTQYLKRDIDEDINMVLSMMQEVDKWLLTPSGEEKFGSGTFIGPKLIAKAWKSAKKGVPENSLERFMGEANSFFRVPVFTENGVGKKITKKNLDTIYEKGKNVIGEDLDDRNS